MGKAQDYLVRLDAFEGPLDLLLYLINRSEVNILEISVSAIAKQYLEYLDLIRELNINLASDYLAMAATLLRLKAREILPQQQPETLEEGEEDIFTREQLIEKLLEYKKFKEAANSLRIYESEQIGSFTRGQPEELEVVAPEEEDSIGSVTIFDLISAFQRILQRVEELGDVPTRVVDLEPVKLDDRIETILGMLEDDREVSFEEFFLGGDRRRMVMVVTFMAVLELVKMQRICFRQESICGSIFVKAKVERSAGVPADTPEAEGSLSIEEGHDAEADSAD